MQFSFPPVTGIAQFVWLNATRTLSGLGSVLATSEVQNQTLAAAASFDFSIASRARMIIVGTSTPNIAGASGRIGMYDGTNTYFKTSIGVNQSTMDTYACSGNNVRAYLNNNGTQNNTYAYSITDYIG